MPSDQVSDLLRHSIYLDLDPDSTRRFKTLADGIGDWESLTTEAESSGIACLVHRHLRNCGITIPDSSELVLKSLAARHTRSNRERNDALVKILEEFETAGIESILLKGMVLIQVLYDDISLRPMGDIDILVSRDKALKAQQLLRDIGYSAGSQNKGYLFDHHHLPLAHKSSNGMSIQVEIHHDALSGDVNESMTFESVANSRIPVSIGKYQTASLGHADMLQHLCHHAFEPCEKIKLGHVADIYGYASRYEEKIDWDEIRNHRKFLFNTMRCLHFLSPLPDILLKHIVPPSCAPPSCVGFGFPTLSSISSGKQPLTGKILQIFNCSPWWMHVHYVTAPEKSLVWVRLFRHPAKVAYWLYRRFLARFRSSRGK